MSIEEAAGRHEARLLLVDGSSDPEATMDEVREAFRDGLLAVLEEAASAVAYDAGRFSVGGDLNETNSKAAILHQRIAALGAPKP